jgi:hypothetical protein
MLEEAKKYNVPLSVAHQVCPKDRLTHPTYRVVIKVYRQDPDKPESEEDELASVGGKQEAPTFKDAYDDLGRVLNEQWSEIAKWATIAEQGL